jgi:hypothetical protein
MARDIISEARAYWERARGGRAMPARADLDPAEMTRFLPNVIMLDVVHDPLDFRYRLVGSEIERHSSERNTGQWMSTMPSRRPPSTVWENLKAVVESRTPSERSIPYVGPHKDFMTTRQITLPLSADGETVDKIMLVIHYVSRLAAE